MFIPLVLSSCNISEFPDILKTLNRLVLHFCWTFLTTKSMVEFPIGHGTWEMIVCLFHNFLTGIERFPWQRLDYLDLHSNLLQGPLPVPPPNMRFFLISDNINWPERYLIRSAIWVTLKSLIFLITIWVAPFQNVWGTLATVSMCWIYGRIGFVAPFLDHLRRAKFEDPQLQWQRTGRSSSKIFG